MGDFARYVKTRWLSLEQCCNKEISKFPAFKSIFLSGVQKEVIHRGNSNHTDASGSKHSTKFKPLKDTFQDPLTEVHLFFYALALSIFTNYNFFLQRGDPLAQVYPVTNELTRELAMRFMLPECY